MPDTTLVWSFVVATLVFAYMPGPSILYAAAQTMARGPRAGWMAALGIHIGGYAHVLAAALGLAVLFTQLPALYTAFKIFDAYYLVWLGLQLWLAERSHENRPAQSAGNLPLQDDLAGSAAFRQSILVEVLNPKTAIFYVAFLPQFTDVHAAWPIWLQLAVLGTLVNFVFSTADGLTVVLASAIVKRLEHAKSTERLLRILGGGILIGLGVHLALSRL